MKYKHKTLSLATLIVTPNGYVTGQCDTCKSQDCSHAIEWQTVSIIGINRKMRCVMNGGEPMFVVECEGYQA